MTKVFIGGSRKLTRLNAAVKLRLDRIIANGFSVLIGDANGVDKAVQQYLHSRRYSKIEVFCSNGVCRNNIGRWPTRAIRAPKGARGFDFYAAKDEQMTEECSIGFMLWDGESRGTLANVLRLLDIRKKVVLYIGPWKQFVTLRSRGDWEKLQARNSRISTDKTRAGEQFSDSPSSHHKQVSLF